MVPTYTKEKAEATIRQALKTFAEIVDDEEWCKWANECFEDLSTLWYDPDGSIHPLSQTAQKAKNNLVMAGAAFKREDYRMAFEWANDSLTFSEGARPHKDFMDARA